MTQPPAGLLAALQKLPALSAVTYRGITAEAVPPTGTVVTPGLTATSRDPRVATENFTTERLLAVAGRTGRDIAVLAQNSAEAEVVYLPGTILRPVQTLRLNDDLEVHLVEEVLMDDPSAPGPDGIQGVDRAQATGLPSSSAALVDLVTNDITAAAGRPHVSVTSPGKFAGAVG